MKTILIAAIGGSLFLSSCKTHFTQTTRNRLDAGGPNRIERLQYYNDRAIELLRVTMSQEDAIKGGKVQFKDGFYYYRVTIPKVTPAIAKNLEPNSLQVYFEQGSDRYLVFRNFNGEFYQLGGESKRGSFYVSFEGREFEVVKGGDALLLIQKRQAVEEESKKRTVKGVKLNG